MDPSEIDLRGPFRLSSMRTDNGERLMQRDDAIDSLDEACQHFLWQRKHEMTKEINFKKIMPAVCEGEFKKIQRCQALNDPSEYAACLVGYKDSVKTKICQAFLNKVAALIFSDIELVKPFISACHSDIKRYNCGRLDPQSPPVQFAQHHLAVKSQESTIHCLGLRLEKLEDACRTQINRITELQSVDFHLDSSIYRACRLDREKLCGSIESGDGRVYECLIDNKNNELMSEACREQIRDRQRLILFSYHNSYTFFAECQADLKQSGCQLVDDQSSMTGHTARAMLCLEASERKHHGQSAAKHTLKPECKVELGKLRKSLFDDHSLSPEVTAHCSHWIERKCVEEKDKPGGVWHCLVGLLSQTAKLDDRPSEKCEAAVHDLLRVTNVEGDIQLDSVVTNACHSLIATACPPTIAQQEHGSLFECLLANRDHQQMTGQCRHHVFQVFYFITRDIALDEKLFSSCVKDAERLCNMHPDNLNLIMSDKSDGQLLTCLYHHRDSHDYGNGTKSPAISKSCRHEVNRVMLDSAASVSLDPLVFEPCLADLAEHCSGSEDYDDDEDEELEEDGDDEFGFKPDGELRRKHRSGMACLQDNMKKLKPKCYEAVVARTGMDEEEPNLNKLIAKACQSAERQFCDNGDDLYHCLIKHKNHPQMPSSCRIALTHLQVVSLTDIRISKNFFHGCRDEIQAHCRNLGNGATVIECLSARLTEDRLTAIDNSKTVFTPSLSQGCINQLEFELYQRTESIENDPPLDAVCHQDAQKLCPNTQPGNSRILTCLRRNRNQLSAACHAKLFKRDLEEAVDAPANSHQLVESCQSMIDLHCRSSLNEPDRLSLESCLSQALLANEDAFDAKCKASLLDLFQLHSQDYRLDLGLRHACSKDAVNLCTSEVEHTSMSSYEEGVGLVLQCLKRHFVQPDSKLSGPCYQQIHLKIALERLHYRLDPGLKACQDDMALTCGRVVVAVDSESPDHSPMAVVDCLTDAFINGTLKSARCKNVVQLIVLESKADIQLDPHLADACSMELATVCVGVAPGHGRQTACLLHVLETQPNAASDGNLLGARCHSELTKRRKLWQTLDSQAPDTLNQLFSHVSNSRSRNFFFMVFACFFMLLFIVGLCCGRCTKRVPTAVKIK